MSNFRNLLKIQFITNFKLNKKIKSGRNGIAKSYSGIILYALLLGGAFFFFGYIYTENYSTILNLFDRADETIPLMIALGGMITLLFSFYSMSTLLYGSKDYEMLTSMPIKTHEIVLSKLAYIYITDLLMSLVIVISCLVKANSIIELSIFINLTYILKVVFITVITPLFALSISIILGTIFSIISSRFRRKNLIQIILYLLLIAGYLALTFTSTSETVDPTKTVGRIFFVYPWINNAINGDEIFILYYSLVSLFGFAFLTYLVCVFYKKLNSIVTTKKTLKNFKLKSYEKKGQLKTLLNKEFKRLFSSPIYVLNCLMGVFFEIVIVVVGLIVIKALDDIIDINEVVGLMSYAPIIMAFFLMMAPTTGCSISVEGKGLWIFKTSPIKPKNFFIAKLLVNAIFYMSSSLVLSIVLVAVLSIEFKIAVLFVVISVLLASFSGVFGLTANILFPHLSWENENQAVKQGVAVLLTVLSAFVLSGLFFVLAYFVEIGVVWLFTIETAFLIIINVVLYIVVFKYGDKILTKRSK